jgi:predicted phage terminase large subunit-like protein
MTTLTARRIAGFAATYLAGRFDSPKPAPPFHFEGWSLYASASPQVALAAPRNSAKSTGFTHVFILATLLFGEDDYVILVGNSEEMAIGHLHDISAEMHENEALRKDFGIHSFEVDQKTDVVVRLTDGRRFRIVARGAGQAIRGMKWNNKRPSLILFDDIEDDESVSNPETRRKFRHWFYRACKQALRDGGRIRGHGTILHEDSLLNRLMKSPLWETRRWSAHAGFDDFSNLLWPEKFPEARLRAIRQEFIDQGDGPGYSQEYLNDPFDNQDQYIRGDDLISMAEADHEEPTHRFAGVDFAISQATHADRTSITVGGKTVGNLLFIVDQRDGRWSADQIIEAMLDTQEAWDIETWFVEDGAIWKAISPTIRAEMIRQDNFLHIVPITPIRDKASRGRSFQKRTRAHAIRFDAEAGWWEEYKYEVLRFTGREGAAHDDRFDSTATLCLGLEKFADLDLEDFRTEEEWAMGRGNPRSRIGRNVVTGY